MNRELFKELYYCYEFLEIGFENSFNIENSGEFIGKSLPLYMFLQRLFLGVLDT